MLKPVGIAFLHNAKQQQQQQQQQQQHNKQGKKNIEKYLIKRFHCLQISDGPSDTKSFLALQCVSCWKCRVQIKQTKTSVPAQQQCKNCHCGK